MTPDELRKRIARWEDPHTDFKQTAGSDTELAKDLVCFANSDGGQLVLGVAATGEVVGVDDVDRVLLRVDDVAFQRCAPPVTVVPETVDMDGKHVVVLHVAKGDQRPYSTKDGRYYIRSGARCRSASREELLRLFQATQAIYYDEQPLPRLDLLALDLDAVRRYMIDAGWDSEADDPMTLIRAWRMFDGRHPTIGGLVTFGHRPQEEIESSRVMGAVFPRTDAGDDLVDRKDMTGDLFDVLQQAEQFLALHLPEAHQIVGFERERVDEVPPDALRESIVNALIHRDYTIPGPVRIFVFADRVEVHSPGRPPNSVDAEAMRAGVHVTRNPHIYSRVVEASLATRAGTGIRRIARRLREVSGAELGITISDAEVVLTLPRRG